MICKKCKQDILLDCMYTNNICVFCYHDIIEWDSNGQLITHYEAIRPMLCPNCDRNMPNADWKVIGGCKWCQK
jgi:hypothetical protein